MKKNIQVMKFMVIVILSTMGMIPIILFSAIRFGISNFTEMLYKKFGKRKQYI